MSQDGQFRKLSDRVLAQSTRALHAMFAISFCLMGVAIFLVGWGIEWMELMNLHVEEKKFLLFAALGCEALAVFYGARSFRKKLGLAALILAILVVIGIVLFA